MSQSFSLNQLQRREIVGDPYPFYHALRRSDPVHWDDYQRAWVLTRYADVVSVLGDSRFSAARLSRSAYNSGTQTRDAPGSAYGSLSRQILFSDPPDHTRIRALVSRVFTSRWSESLRPRIQQIADGLLDCVEPRGQLDCIHDIAYPLPVITIMDVLGLPLHDLDQIKKWCDDYAHLTTLRWDRLVSMLEAFRSLTEYFRTIAANRRAEPRDDLVSALIVDGERCGAISTEELLANCVLLLTAGHETTTNLIGNGLLALLRNPGQLQKLRDDPALISSAVEELLRYDSPVQITTRIAREDVELCGRRIRKGQFVYLLLGAANRDPEQFSEPDRLDIMRHENRHLAFGHGIHFCIGATLGRIERQLVLSTLFRRLPALQLQNHDLEWQPNPIIRGVIALPLRF